MIEVLSKAKVLNVVYRASRVSWLEPIFLKNKQHFVNTDKKEVVYKIYISGVKVKIFTKSSITSKLRTVLDLK